MAITILYALFTIRQVPLEEKMKFKTIMENWRKFNSLNGNLNEQEQQGVLSVQQVNNIMDKASDRELKPNEIEALKSWLQSIPKDDGTMTKKTKDLIADVIDAIQSQEADKTFRSESFTIENIEKDDPELAKAIKIFRGKNIRNSNLLFDGQKLHWRVGKEIIFSWNASSGHFEDDILDDVQSEIAEKAQEMAKNILARAKVTRGPEGAVGNDEAKLNAILKILGYESFQDSKLNDAPYTSERLYEDLTELLDTVDKQKKVASTYRALLKQAKDAQQNPASSTVLFGDERRNKLRKVRKQYRVQDRKIRRLIMRYVEFAVNAEESYYKTSPEARRSQQGIELEGPIPEGKYVVSHTMQDLTNMTGAEPFAQMMASTALLFNDDIGKTDIGELAIRDADAGTGDTAWGRFRVRISNIAGTDRTRNWEKISAYRGQRAGFFIHGGSFRGSSGCIDLSDNMDSFAKFWTVGGVAKAMGRNVKVSSKYQKNTKVKVPKSRRYPEGIRVVNSYWDGGGWIRGRIKIPLFVKYKEREKKRLVAKNPIAKRFAKFIFDLAPPLRGLFGSGQGTVTAAPPDSR